MPGEQDHSSPAASGVGQSVDRGLWTWPNLITFLRLCCLPVFLWMLFAMEERGYAALILGFLGATDWVDGWVARRFDQISEFGKKFDPTADRLMFLVTLVAIMIDGSAPWWFCLLVLVREAAFGAAVAILTLFCGMRRFDVTSLGKWATFILMFVFPGFVMGASGIPGAWFFTAFAWVAGPIGLVLSYYTAWQYLPTIRSSLRSGDESRSPD